MALKISKSHEMGGICFLWIYDIVKYWVFKDLMLSKCIDPLIFLYFDMVTVPPFIIGSARLVNSLTGDILAWSRVLGWGLIVIINTFLPYLYAALAGEAHFDNRAWLVFWTLILLVLANLIRTIRVQVVEKKG
ncbi:MAG: hypothetical protein MI892_11710 [Desulfobacterales bacterium]|nr:hypothetical protein [Desulfobacterales bacterium]